MENWSAQKSVLSRVSTLLWSLLLKGSTVQLVLSVRQKLVSTDLFLIASPFLIERFNYLCMENWSAQKRVLLRVFILFAKSLIVSFSCICLFSEWWTASKVSRMWWRKLLFISLHLQKIITNPNLKMRSDFLLILIF